MPKPAPVSTPNPPLFSQRSVRLLSLPFTAVAGGALTASNLRAVGRPEEARNALWGSVLYTALLGALLYLLADSSNYGAYAAGIGLAGGYGLNGYADKFIPDKKAHPARSIWRPLLWCLLIVGPLLALLIYATPLPQ